MTLPLGVTAADLFAALVSANEPAVLLDGQTADDPRAVRSFIALNPAVVVSARGRWLTVERDGKTETVEADPWSWLDRHPMPLGWFGWLGYDLRVHLEARLRDALTGRSAPTDSPDLWLMSPRTVIEITGSAIQIHGESLPDLAGIIADLRPLAPLSDPTPVTVQLGTSEPDYLDAIQLAKAYIAAGDAYEINLAHRLTAAVSLTPTELHRRLRAVSPTPFGALIQTGAGWTVVSSSPERFVEIQPDRTIRTSPMKGTRPRGATADEDERLRRELVESEKDRAENVMIVDLARHDLGRVAEIGSVRVTDLFAAEPYRTVWQLVSTVVARLRPEVSHADAVAALFPPGSMTGAPKLRAMQLIDELEPVRRGVYAGAVGYLGWGDSTSFSVAIRTVVLGPGGASWHVGGAITADSDPADEWAETWVKARGILAAINGQAEGA